MFRNPSRKMILLVREHTTPHYVVELFSVTRALYSYMRNVFYVHVYVKCTVDTAARKRNSKYGIYKCH